jgi:hypothetical protein
LISPHIAFMTVLLILPHLDRVWRTHVSKEAVSQGNTTPTIPGPGWLREHRVAIKTTIVAVFALSSLQFVVRSRGYLVERPHRPLSGVYKVMPSSDSTAGLVSEPGHWQWAIIAPDGSRLHVQQRDENWLSYPITIDTSNRTLRLNASRQSEWRERWDTPEWRTTRREALAGPSDTLHYVTSDRDVKVDGVLAGRPTSLVLHRVNLLEQFILVGPRRSFEIRDPARTRRDIAKKADSTKRGDPTAKKADSTKRGDSATKTQK